MFREHIKGQERSVQSSYYAVSVFLSESTPLYLLPSHQPWPHPLTADHRSSPQVLPLERSPAQATARPPWVVQCCLPGLHVLTSMSSPRGKKILKPVIHVWVILGHFRSIMYTPSYWRSRHTLECGICEHNVRTEMKVPSRNWAFSFTSYLITMVTLFMLCA